ncbi:MAG: zf-HC2 domain-containing protein [Chloroflexota bacterium]|jgi:hypothetical protein
MSQSTESTHVQQFISDYALGLLTRDEADTFNAHVSRCRQCRQALTQEQSIGHAVKATLAHATMPDKRRLRQLMPAPPPSRSPRLVPALAPGLAAAAIVLVLVFGAISLFSSQRTGSWGLYAPTIQSTSVLMTDTPTQTATREVTTTAEAFETHDSSAPIDSVSMDHPVPPAPAFVPVPAAPSIQ